MVTIKEELRKLMKQSLLVASDIGSQKHYVLFRHPDGRNKKVFAIENNREGFNTLYQKIVDQQREWNLSTVVFGMESTGNYNEGIGKYLMEKGITVVLINGFHTKRLKEISDNSPLKSDLKDPSVIANLMQLGSVMKYWKPEGPAAELRHLNQFREKIVKKRVIALNQVQDALVLVFPEFIKAIGNIRSKTAHYLVSNGYHDPEIVLSCDKEQLILAVRKVSRRHKKAIELVDRLEQAALTTTGIISGKQCVLEEIKWNREQIAMMDQQLRSIESQMQNYCDQIDYSKHLFSVKGLGIVIVSGIIGEIGDFSRFHDINEIIKYAGLNLYEVSSGKYTGTRRITKRGRAFLRKILYLGALSQIRCNPTMKAWYQEMKAKGKNSYSGLVAVSKKLLRICYGLVKHKVDYDPEIVAQSRTNDKKVA